MDFKPTQIHQALKWMRRNSGLTQAQLAQTLGITPGSVGNYENGLRVCPAETVERWAGTCGLEVRLVVEVGATDQQAACSKTEAEMREQLRVVAEIAEQLGAEVTVKVRWRMGNGEV